MKKILVILMMVILLPLGFGYEIALADKYQISDAEIVSGGTSYFGYVNKDNSSNYIMKQAQSGNIIVYTYACSRDAYTTKWTNRATLNYFNYDECWLSKNLN
jgi:hypothetical protein